MKIVRVTTDYKVIDIEKVESISKSGHCIGCIMKELLDNKYVEDAEEDMIEFIELGDA